MVPEKGAPGDFDYLWEEADRSDGVDVVDDENRYASDADLDYLLAEDPAQEHNGFDAFDENTWDEAFTPVAPAPWYRSPQSRTLLIASGVALSAIVVSLVLLVFRGSPSEDSPAPTVRTPATTTPLATATSEAPPPPPPAAPPPPPPPPAEQSTNSAPAAVQPTARPKPTTKEPEIGVTRTPAIRMPLSVAPQPRRAR